MKKILTIVITILCMVVITGCSDSNEKVEIDMPQAVEVLSIKPIITVSQTENIKEEVQLEVRNNMNVDLTNLNFKINNEDSQIKLESLKASEVKKFRCELPIGLNADDSEIKINTFTRK